MCVCVYLGLYVPRVCRSPQTPEEGVRAPGTAVPGGFKPLFACWPLNLSPLWKQAVLCLNTLSHLFSSSNSLSETGLETRSFLLWRMAGQRAPGIYHLFPHAHHWDHKLRLPHLPFTWLLGIWTQSLMLVRQGLHQPGHFLSSSMFIFLILNLHVLSSHS